MTSLTRNVTLATDSIGPNGSSKEIGDKCKSGKATDQCLLFHVLSSRKADRNEYVNGRFQIRFSNLTAAHFRFPNRFIDTINVNYCIGERPIVYI